MALQLPPIPPVLKPIQHYLKTAIEHEQRDPVVAYWCRLFALQTGLKLDRKAKESLAVLTTLMDWLERRKKELVSNEAVTVEVVAQAHLENYALKLFQWADSEDRASRFNKNVVKTFYTAGMLYDVLEIFGEQTEEVLQQKKYAKWKAAYIHNCLKTGETPIPGPTGGDPDEERFDNDAASGWNIPDIPGSQGSNETWNYEGGGGAAPIGFNLPPGSFADPSTSSSGSGMGNAHSIPQGGLHIPSAGSHAPPSTPSELPTTPTSKVAPFTGFEEYKPEPVPGGVELTAEDYTQAQKYCKWAGSALQYEDATTAIDNLKKALKLLSLGQRS